MTNPRDMLKEPEITINGFVLSQAHASTVRVAIAAFETDISRPEMQESLGEIGPMYRERIREVLALILGPPNG